MSSPIAVIISDVHVSMATLGPAIASLRLAIQKANQLKVQLIISGDLHDTKDNLRATCIDAIIECFSRALIPPLIIIGNHDLKNEKGEGHALTCLKAYSKIIDTPLFSDYLKVWFIPYFSDMHALKKFLEHNCMPGSTLIMHQGVETAYMGHYIQDKTSLSKDFFKDYRVISGHYHRRQDIKCGRPRKGAVGLFSYVGNPYTLGFVEANDPEKGFQVLHDDGLLEFVPTNLRKHVIVECTVFDYKEKLKSIKVDDILWVKLSGTKEEITKITKAEIGKTLGHTNFKFDSTPTDTVKPLSKKKSSTPGVLLDALIDTLPESSEQKNSLKSLWKDIL